MQYEERIWRLALNTLSEEVATASYKGFIADLEPILLKGDDFIFTSNSDLVVITINDRYKNIINKALYQASGRNFNTIFIHERDKFKYIKPPDEDVILLNQRYTFDTFVVGNANRFANAAAAAVSKAPGNSYNPLFIYGGVGLGKTHLLHAVGNEIVKNNPSFNIVYVTSENFTNDLVKAIRTAQTQQFRERYRSADLLMIDDIQFISNKDGTQEELFHTFNALYDASKQIVISSDKPPTEISNLEERLRSRFEWGLIADVKPPDLETRIAILQKKASLDNLVIDADVLNFIACIIQDNIRVLEGSLTRVVAYSHLKSLPLNLAIAQEALKDYIRVENVIVVDPGMIKEIICDYYKISKTDIISQKRNKDISLPRQIAMYLCREYTDLSYPKIGEHFGDRHYTTVMHACDRIAQDINDSTEFARQINDIIKKLK